MAPRLIYGTPHVVWEYRWTGRQLTINLWVPGSVPVAAVEAAIRGAWPGAATSRQPVASPIPADAPVVAGGQLLPAYADWLPFATDHDTDPLRAVVAAGTGLRDHEHACVQILARPAQPRRVRRARNAATRLRDGHTATPRIDPGAPLRWLADALLTHRSHATSARPVHGVARRSSATSAPSSRRPRTRCGRPASATSRSTAAPVPGRRRGSVPPRTRWPPRSLSTPDATGSPTGSGSATPPPPSRPGASAPGF